MRSFGRASRCIPVKLLLVLVLGQSRPLTENFVVLGEDLLIFGGDLSRLLRNNQLFRRRIINRSLSLFRCLLEGEFDSLYLIRCTNVGSIGAHGWGSRRL